MIYFLDTSTCVLILRGKIPCREQLAKHLPQDIKIPSMVQAELWTGVRGSANPLRSAREVETFLSPFESIPFDALAATVYAEIRSNLKLAGTPIGPADLVIAATTLAHHGTLVTHNTGEFERIPGLRVQNWS